MWNPKEAGRVFVTLADMAVQGKDVSAGMEIPGLGVINPDLKTHNIIVNQLVTINKDNVDELAAMGL
jgi:simple sugar transport system substrate-binding protein